jgi:hypothetical protein
MNRDLGTHDMCSTFLRQVVLNGGGQSMVKVAFFHSMHDSSALIRVGKVPVIHSFISLSRVLSLVTRAKKEGKM